ncbi:hypothetical protein J5837_00040 [Pseudoxanthomonas helianthi]|uniref:Uncharacterized protein n=1 Tax=Pseudoxanthomonas helianthi TaxID=1453541 RepID=A0A940X162_9GAMM|nr:hypothetical protein [Pseudoxanthomonas helianthi]MBP3982795.1 hypothetical protein [Pseudoxanthomonas helianthi]
MRDLNEHEVSIVDGGNAALLAGLAFVYYERNNIRDFFDGFLDGFDPEN